MNKETLRMQMLAGIITESQYDKKLNDDGDQNLNKYLLFLFDFIDLGDDYESGPQSFTFENEEWADEDNYDNAEMFGPAHEYISSNGQVNIKNPYNDTTLTFTTDGEDIVVSFNAK
jgi:hypothetical protein